MLSQLLEELSRSCVTPLGEALGEAHAWENEPSLLWTPPHMHFPFPDFAFYPFAVINHNPEYNHMPSPVSPSD